MSQKHYPISSTAWDLSTCKYWSRRVQRFRRRCIYKKMHHSTFDLGLNMTQMITQYPLHYVIYTTAKFYFATSHDLGGDAFTSKYNIWPLTLSHETLPSTLLHHMTCAPVNFEVATANCLWKDAFTSKMHYLTFIWYLAQYSLQHMTLKFGFASAKNVWEKCIYKKYIIWVSGQGRTKQEPEKTV